jgi:hypothetical protein
LELSTLKNRSTFTGSFGTQSFLKLWLRVTQSQGSPDLSARNEEQNEFVRMTHRSSFGWQVLVGVLLAGSTLLLSACATKYYKFPEYTYAGRPIPPSKLAERVMISVTANGSSGNLQIVDALRDIRSNVENTIPAFSISGYSSGNPTTIFNFPAETKGYVYSTSDGSFIGINYSTEAATGSAASFPAVSNSVAIPPAATHVYSAEETVGLLVVVDNLTGRTFDLTLPNAFKVFVNTGDTVALAMVRNSNTIYRVFKLNENQYQSASQAVAATGSVDCEPITQPVYCVVPVGGTYDEPSNVYFSLDGTTAYVMNCGPECGGKTASITLLQQGPLNQNVIPSSATIVSPMITNVPIPGGVTQALSDGTTLYIAGQQLQSDGLFEGFLTTMNQATNTVTGTYAISDGTHSKMLFADNNTLWIGSQYCATGERAKLGLNYNCLTMVTLGGTTLTPQIVPNVTPGSATAVVPYPNENGNQYYYGSLTGLCWVQTFNKVYTAYGGQVHVFSTVDGSEINNQFVTVQGTALDVAYMDAATDGAN